MRLYICSISHIFLLCLSICIFLTNCYVHLSAVICFITHSYWLLCRAFCLTSKQINQNFSRENRTLLVLIFPSLPPSLCISLQQALGKQVDATFAEYSNTEVGVSPSVQGSANCKPSHGMLCSSFHRWTMSLNFPGRTNGILALAEDWTVAAGGFARSKWSYFAFIK